MNSTSILGLAAAALGLALPAAAGPGGWYAGASFSQVRGQADTAHIAGELRALGFASAAVDADTKDKGGRVFIGRHLAPWLGAEAYYADLGDNAWSATVTPSGTLSARTESRAWGVALMPGFLASKDLMLFAKLGVARTEAKSRFASSGFVELETTGRKDTRTSGVYGLGAAWRLKGHAFLRIDFDSHDNLGSAEAGGRYRARAGSLGFGMGF